MLVYTDTSPTQKDVSKHKMYHHGNAPKPYQNKMKQGLIERTTYNLVGIPQADAYIYENEIRGRARNMELAETQIHRMQYERARAIGHIAATHGRDARERTERWNIPHDEQKTG